MRIQLVNDSVTNFLYLALINLNLGEEGRGANFTPSPLLVGFPLITQKR